VVETLPTVVNSNFNGNGNNVQGVGFFLFVPHLRFSFFYVIFSNFSYIYLGCLSLCFFA
jgi:hypothetical protein